jgi:hypothetical protein
MSEQVGLRGKAWFKALAGKDSPMGKDPGSVLTADAELACSLSLCAARRSRPGRSVYAGGACARSDRSGRER